MSTQAQVINYYTEYRDWLTNPNLHTRLSLLHTRTHTYTHAHTFPVLCKPAVVIDMKMFNRGGEGAAILIQCY